MFRWLNSSKPALLLLVLLNGVESWTTKSSFQSPIGIRCSALRTSQCLPTNTIATTRTPCRPSTVSMKMIANRPNLTHLIRQQKRHIGGTSSSLSMYNLPPGDDKNGGLGDVVSGVLGLVLVVAFFVSPLGGLVLGIMNSFLLLLILLPLVGTAAFNIWQYFNTVSAPCPNCGAPATVMKRKSNDEDVPSICFSCGAILQANYDNTGIDNITGKNTVDGMQSSPFGTGSIFDIFGGGGPTLIEEEIITTTTTTTPTTSDDRRRKQARDQTIIDVDIQDEDKPFQ